MLPPGADGGIQAAARVQHVPQSGMQIDLLDKLSSRSIVIVGMMAAGKSRMGKLLAARLGLPFTDLDTEIENISGLSVSEIFHAHGEPEFRRLEEAVLRRLLRGEQSVVALGGGAWMSPRVRAWCDARAISIWLDTPLELMLQRVARTNKRPLLAEQDLAASMAELLESRRSTYGLANLRIRTAYGTAQMVVEAMLSALDRLPNQSAVTKP